MAKGSGRLVAAWITAGVLAGLGAGCAGGPLTGGGDTPDTTNAPADGFAQVAPGSKQDFIMNVGRRTYFAGGAADLDTTAKRTLDKQAVWLRAHPEWYAKLQGHADDPGNAAANQTLSAKRAEAVMSYLVAQGVPATRLWAKGYARQRPVRACSEIECTAQNRRVVTNLRREKDESAPD
ncbi:peptidoglycan-associated lipoprotein [Breoghania corrubedonensis]|uniref:Peptidoglycan-associated lipoprotein n=1 Tax=Breoghania corrubedonensis TaxID=665038 RepID=A0A2T5VG88_9HYPH|nr:peptidoglycan-associated lipoprotein [Breoghania corrubedonensis]